MLYSDQSNTAAGMRSRGFFIAVEGIDGSGKSGVTTHLAAALGDAGFVTVTTHEPGGTEAGAALRKLLLARDAFDWTSTAELLLLNAGRRQHVERLIAPALEAGNIVLCDRFVGSTLAYQGAGRGLARETILDLHRLAIDDLWPDLTLVLDVAPEIGLKRSRGRLERTQVDEGRFEALDLAFHQRVRQSFLDQAREKPLVHRVIDSDRPPESVRSEAVEIVLKALAERGVRA